MYEDALGRPLKPGDVIVKFHCSSSSVRSQVGVVRELLPDGDVRWQFVSKSYARLNGGPWREDYALNKPSTFYRSEYCVIDPMTEGELREKYHITD